MTETKQQEEVLQLLWTLYEEKKVGPLTAEDERFSKVEPELWELLAGNGYVTRDPWTNRVLLTPQGFETARTVTRRHRLAERLLTDVLSFDLGTGEGDACELEHILSPEVTRSICILLGHPTECPCGFPIPPGDCCGLEEHKLGTVVQRLSEVDPGKEVKIAHIATRRHSRLDRLTSLNLFPGQVVRVHQVRPVFVIQIGETTVALDREVADDIRVWRVGAS